MPERPVLLLHRSEEAARTNLPPGFDRHHFPPLNRQRERIGPQLERLQREFEARKTELRADAAGTTPEQVLVLETVGGVEGFWRAVEKAGLEWLGEWDGEKAEPDDDFHKLNDEGERTNGALPTKLYLVLVSESSLRSA